MGIYNLQAVMESLAPPNIVTDGLVLALDAGDPRSYPGTGTTWFDTSGNGNDGTLTNGPTYSSDNGGSIVFDGDNDYVDLGTITTANPLQLSSPSGGGLTIMFAVWFDTGGDGFQRVIDKSNSGSAANGWAIYPNSGTPNAGTLIFQTNVTTAQSSTIVPTANTWSIWAFTWSSANDAWNWYQNDTNTNSGTSTYNIPSVETNARIGSWNHSTARELNGKVGFTFVYDRALSDTEIQQNYNALRGRFGL